MSDANGRRVRSAALHGQVGWCFSSPRAGPIPLRPRPEVLERVRGQTYAIDVLSFSWAHVGPPLPSSIPLRIAYNAIQDFYFVNCVGLTPIDSRRISLFSQWIRALSLVRPRCSPNAFNAWSVIFYKFHDYAWIYGLLPINIIPSVLSAFGVAAHSFLVFES